MSRHWRHKLEVAVLSFIGFTGFFFLFQSNKNGPGLKEAIGTPVTIPPIITERPKPIAECWENVLVANISGFAKLPDHIKDFLRYKHCKEFPLLLDMPDKCGGPDKSYDTFLLLAIKSSPGNYERREIIRKTWGQERTYAGVNIRRLFLSGQVANARDARKTNQLLKIEAEENGDILQWNFLDSFFNLTLKQVLFHSWMEAHCPGVRFVFNGDDDVFANTDNIIRYLLDVPGAGDEHLFVGQLITNVGPIREKWSKYYVPEQVTASKSYPPYCGGGGLLMSGYTSRTIYKESLGIELFPIDDVYLGMCLEKAGLKPSSHMGIRTVGVHVPSSKLESFDPCYYKELLLVHRFVPYEMLVMWRAIHQPNLICGKKMEVYQSL
ncbi:N-acetyllactosaminide beta-1,3-N-acetylglucosaminyltransferase 3 [Heteronotia binoei]|uniref:N-acetyllactosaminide beta-1,3-N-acetylglucosaminyltransferase 3 n=1 Tax=Heteronotia binoei TaxID=13085 RepID=UPI00292FEE99|nr:N-acetyllactosaminide beta-1,3-N-acetylglucosaminyltransferase 3 [Heteronotia binoei]XP_060088525.1 N-acetyllactosaminide beta-1,3-N-acetylglucosaminyltransferase 3 [Heteronotia binoei]XP_060088526.1 N-acetyllactosaminide beta-1,3-N-acetylglucosaminyltransferase 3 [Heteronotia binoei]XP_060088527.1 N-acetyllactosaminide beta-1,3-N-acetylglucosaminyltransferase 3 [Heteronotia binoei]XP_060088528.1 N-acetyllactosaminide beta-1,3-N-acetylglucosaminyltransferase 3 [Heteronotia binoei]XP_0600885